MYKDESFTWGKLGLWYYLAYNHRISREWSLDFAISWDGHEIFHIGFSMPKNYSAITTTTTTLKYNHPELGRTFFTTSTTTLPDRRSEGPTLEDNA